MKRLATIFGLLLLAGADKPPTAVAPPPTPPPAPVYNQPSVWQQIQPSLNRSNGRIVDEPSYQLYQIQRQRDEDLGKVPVQTDSQRFREERERQLRIAQRSAQEQKELLQSEAAKNSGLIQTVTTLDPSPVAAQAMADELALARLRNARDKQLTAANEQRLADLKQRPNDRSQIDTEYQKQVDEIEQQFETRRNVILDDGSAPTTQP